MSFTQVELERKLLCCRLHYVCERLIIGIGLIKLSDIVFEWKGFSNRIRSRTRKRGKRKHSAIETRTQNKGSSKKYLWNYFPIKMTFEQRQKSHSSCNAVDLNSLSENWRLYRFPAPDRNAVARQRQIWKKKHKFVELRIMHFHILSGGRRSFFRFLKCDIFEDSGILLLAQILNIFSLTKWLEI